MNKDITIIIPAYNSENYILECLNSIYIQILDDVQVEILIINDGSTDNTKKIIEREMLSDCRINLINIKNGGVSNARNVGIQNAKGKYIVFIDADDTIKNRYIETLLNLIRLKECQLVMASYTSIFEKKNEVNKICDDEVTITSEDIFNQLIYKILFSIDKNGENIKAIGGCVWRSVFIKEIIERENIKFNTNLKIGEDMIFLVEYISKCQKIYLTEKSIYNYNRKGENSTTQKYVNDLLENIQIFNEQLEKIINFENFKDEIEYKNILEILYIISNESKGINNFKRIKNILIEAEKICIIEKVKVKQYIEKEGCFFIRILLFLAVNKYYNILTIMIMLKRLLMNVR